MQQVEKIRPNTLEKRSSTIHHLQKYVVAGVGIWAMFMLTFAIAYHRVANSEKYNGLPFNSLEDSDPQRPASFYPN